MTLGVDLFLDLLLSVNRSLQLALRFLQVTHDWLYLSGEYLLVVEPERPLAGQLRVGHACVSVPWTLRVVLSEIDLQLPVQSARSLSSPLVA